MDLYLVNTLNGFIPAHESDRENKKRFKIGKVYKCTIRVGRNYEFHKKFYALCQFGFENQDWCLAFDPFRKWLTMKAGWVTATETPTGMMYEAKSISFGSMKQPEFEQLYSAVISVLMKEIGMERESIEQELIHFM